MICKAFEGKYPKIHESAFIAETAVLIGDVEVGENSSVWYGAVVRGDESPIRIGKNTSIQDNVVLHCNGNSPMSIGDNVTVGHSAMVHGAVIGDNVLVGMGSIVLNGAKVGDNCIIGAGAVVKERAEIPANSMLAGVPAVIKRTLSEEEITKMQQINYYVKLSRAYLKEEEGTAK